MAKGKPTLTLSAMEKELGYDGNSLKLTAEDFRHFYSDFRPVGEFACNFMEKEYEEYRSTKKMDYDAKTDGQGFSIAETMRYGQQKVTVTQRSIVGFHRFAVDIHYAFGLHIPLLLTENEATHIMSVAQLQPHVAPATMPKLFQLPREIRERIYTFALSRGRWHIEDIDNFNKVTLMSGIGDPSGFYFPLSSKLGMINVNRQMRDEVLSLAYQHTTFHLDDMDDLLKLLIAVGEIGRANIRSLHFPWESRSDLECKWEENPASDDNFLQLPILHVMECVQLLKQCDKLRSLDIYFEADIIEGMDPDVFNTNPGIEALYSVQVENVEIWNLGHEPLGHCPLAYWLKKGMQSDGGGK